MWGGSKVVGRRCLGGGGGSGSGLGGVVVVVVVVVVVIHFHNDITSVGSGWRELVT